MPAKVKKRDGHLEDFMEAKIIEAVKKAGATMEQAVHVAKEVTAKVAKMALVTTAQLAKMVVDALKKVNKKAAAEFARYRAAKAKAAKKKK